MPDPENPKKIDFVGNRTECALLVMTRNWDQDYKALRDLHHEATVGAPRGLELLSAAPAGRGRQADVAACSGLSGSCCTVEHTCLMLP